LSGASSGVISELSASGDARRDLIELALGGLLGAGLCVLDDEDHG
jgi:hypothetical protein